MVSLKVEGMSCQHCVESIQSALAPLGIQASVDLEKKTVTLDKNSEEIDINKVTALIEDQGYDIASIN